MDGCVAKDVDLQSQILREVFTLVSKRPVNACNFVEGSKLLGGDGTRIIYRLFATLYFVFVVDCLHEYSPYDRLSFGPNYYLG